VGRQYLILVFPEAEIAIAKITKYKSPGSDQIPTVLIQAGGETLWSEIHKIVHYIRNKEELFDQYQFTKWAINVSVVIVVRYHCY
jgi:hypothetical protein